MGNQKKKKGLDMQVITIVTVLLVVLGLGIYSLVSNLTGSSSAESVKQNNDVLTKGQPAIGSPDAPVKLVEFGDYKCPSCKMFHDEVYPKLKKDFIDTGKVQMHFVNMAFLGPDSMTAAMAGESIFKQKPEAFWKFYDIVYQNQQAEDKVWATPEFLTDLVKKNIPEVDVNKLSQDLKNNTFKSAVDSDNLLAQTHQVNSVPTVYVNGKKVDSSMKYEELKKAIEKELQGK
ncbi:DsbA family protein [Thermoflavimicrobium daqui]|uniref:Thioredoxin domain-containing protein n=1 Tax=Thermoflavimicrobium daqui TaxID=2137476 RepID=A0A364K931_9BACL|nr:DsbA family protein [Thermoflavimicrobium daqui]RAL26801.1 hypothetical protein DL897_01745 [Thermoflavimicrobium daqui]